MKNILTLCFVVFLYTSATAQTLYIHSDPATRKQGIKDANGNIVIPPVYDFLMRTGPTLFIAQLDKKYGLITDRNVIVHPFEWDNYTKIVGPHALYRITAKNKHGLLNRTGVVVPTEYDEISYNASGGRRYIQAARKNKHGFIDTLGQVRIPMMYEKTDWFIKGLAPVMKNGKWGLVDTLNKERLPFQYDCCFSTLAPTTDAIVVRRGGSVGIVDVMGKTILPLEYDGITGSGVNGLLAMKKNNKYGFIDSFGKLVLPVVYDTFMKRQPGYVWLLQNEKWGAIDSGAKIKSGFKYQWVGEWKDGLLPVGADGKAGYLDEHLKEKIAPVYDAAAKFVNKLAWVRKGNLIGQIKPDGSFNWPLQFQGIKVYDDNFAIVQKDGKAGIINPEGKMLLPPNYEYIGYANSKKLFEKHYVPIVQHNKVGMVQWDGKVLVAPDYYNVLPIEGYFLALKNKGEARVAVFDDRGTFIEYRTFSAKERASFNRN